jgi:adenosylhomocysteine nucleosidase
MKLKLIAAAAALLASAWSFAAQAAELLDNTPRVAVISAFQPEWVELQKDLTGRKEHMVNGRQFLTGQIAGKDVVLFLSGVSMVNASMTTQLALDRFKISSILFSGIAGGVDPKLHVGDVVVADQWGQYLEAIFARKTGETYTIPPFIKGSGLAGYGMIVPNTVSVVREGAAEKERFWFPVDKTLLEAARKVAGNLKLDDCAADNQCLSRVPQIVVGGNGVSGPAFVDNAEFRQYTLKIFDAKVLDMESAAVAHVAYSNTVPFLAVRSLSDLAGGGEGENQMATFMALASSNSAAVVEAILREMK